MKKIKILKRNGGHRTIYVPNSNEKSELRSLLFSNDFFSRSFSEDVQGFVRGRSVVTNAKKHIGFNFTIEFDLKDFFDSVTVDKFKKGVISEELSKKCFIDGAARQGLPTSPFLSNLAGEAIDRSVTRALKKKVDAVVVYTRYADDIFVSYNEDRHRKMIIEIVESSVKRCGFTLNSAKTQLLDANNGRRIICGVSVGTIDVHAPRKIRRRLRAALHQGNLSSAKGIAEFCKLKEPRMLDHLW